MDSSTNVRSRLPDIFEPDVYNRKTTPLSLNVLFMADFNVEQALESDSPAARYNRRRVASCSAYSKPDTSTVCSQHVMSDSDFSRSEEFLLLSDDCYDYPTSGRAATISAGGFGRLRRRGSSLGKLKTMVSTFFTKPKM
ncbi:hypothetical protein IWW55_003504 [Coemansia sp. RSA 2706]|nr:hypothetical protein LPJ63_004000 [Coemansia sp. RSA 2711]KAJ2302243.1 hypothetical protein IWW55_003504 [Coemansia sp. RSA 2706]KAJ2312022.1 hypothetical protein IWW54_002329 [Coemansia sp. RSA 2705]KAJ2319374.1 hypothetical protein IWW52_002012 [Coemansia sp. RSA 2704]KAJ2323358.1 hypothetical protein IWW51_003795 [Coemansia sp. RSA 2702]KAJ2381156.1 hypothetical protein H4S02_006343 [Coemansia sp. RSA 2611]KAJ2737252.1 hypothetical protein H4R23_001880 [Coemansia sp. Cherry 401B]